MAGNDGNRTPQHAFVLLVVAAADSAGVDAHQPRIIRDLGHRDVARLELARRSLDHREAGLGQMHDAVFFLASA